MGVDCRRSKRPTTLKWPMAIYCRNLIKIYWISVINPKRSDWRAVANAFAAHNISYGYIYFNSLQAYSFSNIIFYLWMRRMEMEGKRCGEKERERKKLKDIRTMHSLQEIETWKEKNEKNIVFCASGNVRLRRDYKIYSYENEHIYMYMNIRIYLSDLNVHSDRRLHFFSSLIHFE